MITNIKSDTLTETETTVIVVSENSANHVENSHGEWFHPTGYVTPWSDNWRVVLDDATFQQVKDNFHLLEAAREYVRRAAVGIINLTQHDATPDQVAAGVIEPRYKGHIGQLLTFMIIPEPMEIHRRAKKLAEYAYDSGCKKAMIGGAPYLMAALERALYEQGITPVYAFSQRESVETIAADGSVVKSSVFKHVGFVEPPSYF